AGKNQVEPDNIRLAIADRPQQLRVIAQTIDGPAALHVKLRQLRFRSGILIGQDLQTDQRIGLQLSCYVISVFVEDNLARRKAADKANLHGPLKPKKSKSAPQGAARRCGPG